MSVYDIVIGLEVHAQLATRTKIFCGCRTDFGAEPNSQVCSVCAGYPGVLPVLNRRVFELGLKAAVALGAEPARHVQFDRKNYFYPDLPKGYQISQFRHPIGSGGEVEIDSPDGTRLIKLVRLHLEEDAGKLIHDASGSSLVDLNRAGVPLAEIVSEPVLKTPEEAQAYLIELRAILRAAGVSDADMEKGQLRCDANISLRKTAADPLGTKVEIKNMNSFRHVRDALAFEITRQAKVLDAGELIVQETRLWDPDAGRTASMRSKEEAHDYRYFPEPDLVPFEVDDERIRRIRETLEELPRQKRTRFCDQYGLNLYDAGVLMADDAVCRVFEELAGKYASAKTLANWLTGPVTAYLNEQGLGGEALGAGRMDHAGFLELLVLVDGGKVSLKAAREKIFPEFMKSGKRPSVILEESGLAQISDDASLITAVDEVLQSHPGPVADFRAGKTNALQFLVGQLMKATRGKANPARVKTLLEERLGR
ncbi:MAG: Asp-tRNA(Asn)/Glu-tRNA(Gln) amidotransferase subunit GatB [Candidatus Omnitrophica bacterium]|nr:Asp-tRNA(Asn)/Glu-tRNA(Gln) amidotransferase subunit GatB [Candidatus Omnitrophota bacterium]